MTGNYKIRKFDPFKSIQKKQCRFSDLDRYFFEAEEPKKAKKPDKKNNQ